MNKLIYIFLFCAVFSGAQERVSGVIFTQNDEGEELPLPGANVYWLDSKIGSVTDFDGKFDLPFLKEYSKLVVSFVGYKTDTITIMTPKVIRHILKSTSSLDEVTVKSRKQATARSFLKAQQVITVSSDELLKAACCNLSESFETNPSIDVNFADAVTGTRQIKMLGLTSPYILIATENIPSIRGASQAFGMSFIPGTWVESIQITKGAGSVVNGYESIAGQINAELVKPSKDKKLFVNSYASANGRLELNTHLNTKISDKWDTGLYIHGNTRRETFDKNEDGFLDVPLMKQVNLMNRWQYTNPEKGVVSFFNIKYLNDEKQAGQVNYDKNTDRLTTNAWGSEIDSQRTEASAKLGYVNPEIPYQSLGFQVSYSNHKQDSYFGLNRYDIQHNSVYANIIYNSIISDSRHKIKTGLSYTYDHYDELVNSLDFQRSERGVGAFFEYNYDNLDKLNLTAGLRVDTHNVLGTFITPRLHLRYTPWEKSALRASFGRGKRSANIFAENQKIFATSRVLVIENSGGNAYGLNPEIAWNYGLSFLQGFKMFGRKADVTLDYYRTNFQNQVVVDYELPQEVRFSDLIGKSFANSFQAELNMNMFEGFDLRMAYKFYDVQTQYQTGQKEKPLTPKDRIFANMSYETKAYSDSGSQWKFDLTFNWLGKQRFPSTVSSPVVYQLAEFTPNFSTLNTQITKVFSHKFEVYLGAENLGDQKQERPILGAEDPFGSYFDTTFVYGSIFGSSYYAGLRYKLL